MALVASAVLARRFEGDHGTGRSHPLGKQQAVVAEVRADIDDGVARPYDLPNDTERVRLEQAAFDEVAVQVPRRVQPEPVSANVDRCQAAVHGAHARRVAAERARNEGRRLIGR